MDVFVRYSPEFDSKDVMMWVKTGLRSGPNVMISNLLLIQIHDSSAEILVNNKIQVFNSRCYRLDIVHIQGPNLRQNQSFLI